MSTVNFMKPLIITDVDDVLLDWLKSFKRFLKTKNIETNTPELMNWDLRTWVKALPEEILPLVREFNNSKAFAKIPALEDAKEVLPRLRRSHDFVAVTACARDEKTVRQRKNNLEILGIDFKDIHCVEIGEDKSEILKNYPESIWVEDKYEGALQGVKVGHKSFLINRSYNLHQNHDSLTKVSCWREIEKLIKK